jgi:hypothetical protein
MRSPRSARAVRFASAVGLAATLSLGVGPFAGRAPAARLSSAQPVPAVPKPAAPHADATLLVRPGGAAPQPEATPPALPPAARAVSAAPAAAPTAAQVLASGGPTVTGRPARRAARATPPSGTGSVAAVEAMFDATGWNWRAAGVTIRLGFHPDMCCHWGVFDNATSTIWFGPGAFATPARLRYVAFHELGHAWQYRSGHLGELVGALAPWGRRGAAGIEAGADCVASVWGAPGGNYWSCPRGAAALMQRRLAGDWSAG